MSRKTERSSTSAMISTMCRRKLSHPRNRRIPLRNRPIPPLSHNIPIPPPSGGSQGHTITKSAQPAATFWNRKTTAAARPLAWKRANAPSAAMRTSKQQRITYLTPPNGSPGGKCTISTSACSVVPTATRRIIGGVRSRRLQIRRVTLTSAPTVWNAARRSLTTPARRPRKPHPRPARTAAIS